MAEKLTTPAEVIDVLGGSAKVAELTGRKLSAASNWRSFDKFPPNTFLVLTAALRAKGKSAPSSLWGMVERPAQQETAGTAA